MKRVIIAGSRSFDDYQWLSSKVNLCLAQLPSLVLCGMAEGADLLGKKWAEENGVPVAKVPADWEKYGRAAGVIRNGVMVENADVLVAFWDGESSGTYHIINYALNHGLEVHVYPFKKKSSSSAQS